MELRLTKDSGVEVRVRFPAEQDDYESVSDNECEYGREALRRMGANEEVMDCIDSYIDFDRLGRDMMKEDGVRQTVFGLVRRLSTPFPPEQEMGMQMQ